PLVLDALGHLPQAFELGPVVSAIARAEQGHGLGAGVDGPGIAGVNAESAYVALKDAIPVGALIACAIDAVTPNASGDVAAGRGHDLADFLSSQARAFDLPFGGGLGQDDDSVFGAHSHCAIRHDALLNGEL